MVELRGRVAVITGASRGLGAICARHLGREGMRLALVARTEADLQARAEELRADGVDATAMAADVTQPDQVEALIRRVEGELGGPYLVVNSMNTGSLLGGAFAESSLEQWEQLWRVKPQGFYLVMRSVLPGMLARGEGCILNIASGAGKSGSPGFALFSATEHAIVGLTDTVAREVQGQGVHVSVLCPWGVIDSERTRRMFPDRDPGEWMNPDDLAETLTYLAKRSPRAWVREVIVRSPGAVD